jgi:hypothetical protein
MITIFSPPAPGPAGSNKSPSANMITIFSPPAPGPAGSNNSPLINIPITTLPRDTILPATDNSNTANTESKNKDIGGKIQDGLQDVGGKIQRGTQDLGNQIQGEFRNVLDKIKGGTQDVQNIFKNLLDQINHSLGDFSQKIQNNYNDNIQSLSQAQTRRQIGADAFNTIVNNFDPTVYAMRDTFKTTINTVITVYNEVVLAIAFIPDKDQNGFRVTLDKSYQMYKDALKSTRDKYTSFVNSSHANYPQSNIDYDSANQKITNTYDNVVKDSDVFYQKALTTIKANKDQTLQSLATPYVDAIHIDKNNFSLEQIQLLGRTKQTWESNITQNGQFNNIVSYNPKSPNLFYSMIDSANVPSDYKTNHRWALPHRSQSQFDISCNIDLSNNRLSDNQIKALDPTFYSLIQGIFPDQNMSIRDFCSSGNQISAQISAQYDSSCNAVFFDNTKTDYEIDKANPVFDSLIQRVFPDKNMSIRDFCYKRELAKNAMNADAVQQHGESHDKATTGYLERKTDYNVQIINIFNFSLGIALMMGAIYSYSY